MDYPQLRLTLEKLLNAAPITQIDPVQTVWSGFGVILRVSMPNSYPVASVIVKYCQAPNHVHHPRGWHSDLATQRKLRSYAIEQAWYQNNKPQTDYKFPTYITATQHDKVQILVLEDLQTLGYTGCSTQFIEQHPANLIHHCLNWLAQFHSQFVNSRPNYVWPQGNYWHLSTRQQEWQAMPNGPLKHYATDIDQGLQQAKHKTLIHGDAKIANFCQGSHLNDDSQTRVASLDFQYIGGGIGVQDVVYFLGSCLNDTSLKQHYETYLNYYFEQLKSALARKNFEQVEALISEWRQLEPLVWADFERFLCGWSPGHKKLTAFSAMKTRFALSQL